MKPQGDLFLSTQEQPLSPEEPSRAAEPERTALTVSALTRQIRSRLEPGFSDVWVQGEVSNYRPASSGHAYFSLKDAEATVAAAIFGWSSRKAARGARFDLQDGLAVICHGKISVYPPRGNYQLVIDQIEPVGAGALQLAFEQLKEKLKREGLFDPARKKRLPEFPKRIAVITSPSGAVIRDMMNVLSRRAPQIEIVVIPAMVQGAEAAPRLVQALKVAEQHRLGDVIVLARGGGSIEDLWCFNDEGLARAISECKLPIISAVGHEIDFTISDFVADLRAPTPSAAAEILSGHWVDSARQLIDARRRLVLLAQQSVARRKAVLEQVIARLVSPRDRLRLQAQRCDELQLRLDRAMGARLERLGFRLGDLSGRLDALSPLRVLERGYSLVRKPDGELVRSSKKLKPGLDLEIQFHDGKTKVRTK